MLEGRFGDHEVILMLIDRCLHLVAEILGLVPCLAIIISGLDRLVLM